MKVKTLKDIRKQVYSQCKNEAEKRLLEHLFRLEDEEAIKWVKNERAYNNKFRDARADIMMEFHDITEEELK